MLFYTFLHWFYPKDRARAKAWAAEGGPDIGGGGGDVGAAEQRGLLDGEEDLMGHRDAVRDYDGDGNSSSGGAAAGGSSSRHSYDYNHHQQQQQQISKSHQLAADYYQQRYSYDPLAAKPEQQQQQYGYRYRHGGSVGDAERVEQLLGGQDKRVQHIWTRAAAAGAGDKQGSGKKVVH